MRRKEDNKMDIARNIVKRSGNSFQYQVVNFLRESGWSVLVSPYYTDNLTDKPREIDIIAEKAFTKAGLNAYVSNKNSITIDLIIRRNKNTYYDVQVSSVRENKHKQNYIFYKKKDFKPRKNLLVALLIFGNNETPEIYLIPSLSWRKEGHSFLIEGGFESGSNKPEFAISINRLRIGSLKESFSFHKQVVKL